jgi:hypothetical protein
MSISQTHTEQEITRYVVIESTPGYMPEDCDPLVTEDYAEAVAYANELADELEEQGYACDRSWASSNNFYAIKCELPRGTVAPDLGRYIAVELDES